LQKTQAAPERRYSSHQAASLLPGGWQVKGFAADGGLTIS
jgi:hypothetical protein